MKNYFSKEIQTYCNFTFKNEIFTNNQQPPLFKTYKNQQRQHKNKQDKVSLKKVRSQQIINLNNYLSDSTTLKVSKIEQREGSMRKISQINRKSLVSSIKKDQNIFTNNPRLNFTNLTKSLPKDLNRKGKQKRNLIKELKQYKMNKESKVCLPMPQGVIFNRPNHQSPPHKLYFRNANGASSPTNQSRLQKCGNQSGYFTPNPKQLLKNNFYFQSNRPHKRYETNFNSQFKPLQIQKIQSEKYIQLNVPYQPSQYNYSSKGDQFIKQVYNDYDLDYEIKLDLISSIKANRNQVSSFKPEESMRSTMISPSQMKYKKYDPSINFSTPISGFKKMHDYDTYDPNIRQLNSKSSSKRDKLQDKKIIDRRERFKSIVSVHSQQDGQEESMKDSIVLESHNNLRLSGRVTKLV